MPICPSCQSSQVIKNGHIHTGKAKYACKDCGRQFVENPQQHRISEQTKALIDKLLLERLSLSGIARVTGVAERWLQYYVNGKYARQPQLVEVAEQNTGQKKEA